jgi:hypothetical protein
MASRVLFDGEAPISQSVESVKALIAFYDHGQVPTEMPAFYRVSEDLVLVRSNKGDAYYVVTPKVCSCPAATYRPGGPCKHMRLYFPESKKIIGIPMEVPGCEESFVQRGGFRPTFPGE